MSFKTDLIKGERIENLFVRSYNYHNKRQIIPVFPEEHERKFWDVSLNGTTYELKSQIDASKNFAIETKYKGYPSGLAATKADYFVIYHDQTFYVWNTEDLKEFLRSLIDMKEFGKTEGGDNNDAEIYYFRKEYIINDAEEQIPLHEKESIAFDFDTERRKLAHHMPLEMPRNLSPEGLEGVGGPLF